MLGEAFQIFKTEAYGSGVSERMDNHFFAQEIFVEKNTDRRLGVEHNAKWRNGTWGNIQKSF